MAAQGAESEHETPGADLDWSDWNDLRVISEDHARDLRAKYLLAREERSAPGADEHRWQRADRLRQKVTRAFYRASETP